MALPIKENYIDATYKSRDSISSSSLKIVLPETISFPDNSAFYLDDVSTPNSWYTVEENVNDGLYLHVSPISPDEDGTGVAYNIVSISAGIHNDSEIAIELQTKIEAFVNNSLVCFLEFLY